MMLDLAAHSEEGYISLKTIADRQGISMKYLEAIVGNLKRADLLDSTRGKEGGYKLHRPVTEYRVGEILRCMEGNLAPVTAPMWVELDEITSHYLNSITLFDLLSGEKWRK